MFWKLALTIAVVLLVAGRTSVLHHPAVRLLLPRSWVAALSMVPSRRVPLREPSRGDSPPRPLLDRKARIVLSVLAVAAIAALLATRLVVTMEADPGLDP